jgi:two-component system OmpR family response regulator
MPMLVLLTEDDEDYAEIIAQTVRRDSHDVAITGSAAAALRFASQRQPSLAILDVSLPDGSGIDLCKRLRETIPGLPVVFLSSLDRSADVVAGLILIIQRLKIVTSCWVCHSRRDC